MYNSPSQIGRMLENMLKMKQHMPIVLTSWSEEHILYINEVSSLTISIRLCCTGESTSLMPEEMMCDVWQTIVHH